MVYSKIPLFEFIRERKVKYVYMTDATISYSISKICFNFRIECIKR